MAGLRPGHPRLGLRTVKTWMPGTSPGMTAATAELRRRVREAVALELVAQLGFQDLAGRGVRDALDEGDVIGHPPFRDLAFHEFQDLLARCALALLELHDQKRTLVPLRMVDADHRGFRHRRMADREIFQVDRGN